MASAVARPFEADLAAGIFGFGTLVKLTGFAVQAPSSCSHQRFFGEHLLASIHPVRQNSHT